MNEARIIKFGRRKFSFSDGKVELESTSVTERALASEDEETFTNRLLQLYSNREGTIEIVFRRGQPDYAIITFSQGY